MSEPSLAGAVVLPGRHPAGPVSEPERNAHALLARLDDELAPAPVDVELCLVGGVVMSLVFARHPQTRRPSALFGPRRPLHEAAASVAQRQGLSDGWMEDSVSSTVSAQAGRGMFEGRHLRAFAPPPDYVLAMKCAELAFAEPDGGAAGADSDLWYLIRHMNLREPDQVLQLVSRHLNDRQRPADLPNRLSRIFGR